MSHGKHALFDYPVLRTEVKYMTDLSNFRILDEEGYCFLERTTPLCNCSSLPSEKNYAAN